MTVSLMDISNNNHTIMEFLYQIRNWRHDVPRANYGLESFAGESVEECDEKAKKWFKTESEKPSNSWEGMELIRVDSPGPPEKTTFVCNNGKQDSMMDWQL